MSVLVEFWKFWKRFIEHTGQGKCYFQTVHINSIRSLLEKRSGREWGKPLLVCLNFSLFRLSMPVTWLCAKRSEKLSFGFWTVLVWTLILADPKPAKITLEKEQFVITLCQCCSKRLSKPGFILLLAISTN